MIGWLLDTNVIAGLINPNGAPSVKIWASEQPEDALFLSILTLGKHDKGIHAIDTHFESVLARLRLDDEISPS